jgi:NADP-dependent alcohol dehydrogenase
MKEKIHGIFSPSGLLLNPKQPFRWSSTDFAGHWFGNELDNSYFACFNSGKTCFWPSARFAKIFGSRPRVCFSLPDRQVANGVVDAYAHVLEQYLTYPVNSPLQDRFAEGILHTLIEEGPKVLANRTDYDAAANFMWSATMALNGLIALGVPTDWATHMIGHELTAFHGIDHARTLAIVFPGMMHVKRKNKKDKILQYGERIWGITEGTDDERIDKTIAKTVEFFESLGVPCTLPEYDVPAETIGKIKNRFKQRKSKLGEKQDIDYKQVEEILMDRL